MVVRWGELACDEETRDARSYAPVAQSAEAAALKAVIAGPPVQEAGVVWVRAPPGVPRDLATLSIWLRPERAVSAGWDRDRGPTRSLSCLMLWVIVGGPPDVSAPHTGRPSDARRPSPAGSSPGGRRRWDGTAAPRPAPRSRRRRPRHRTGRSARRQPGPGAAGRPSPAAPPEPFAAEVALELHPLLATDHTPLQVLAVAGGPQPPQVRHQGPHAYSQGRFRRSQRASQDARGRSASVTMRPHC